MHSARQISADALSSFDTNDNKLPILVERLCNKYGLSLSEQKRSRVIINEVIRSRGILDYIIEKWTSLNPQEYGRMVVQPNASVLMIPSGSELPEEGDPFETPTSMRNVDKECQARIITSYRGTE